MLPAEPASDILGTTSEQSPEDQSGVTQPPEEGRSSKRKRLETEEGTKEGESSTEGQQDAKRAKRATHLGELVEYLDVGITLEAYDRQDFSRFKCVSKFNPESELIC